MKRYQVEIAASSRRSTARTVIRSVLVAACWLAVSTFSFIGVAGCSNENRRLSESETLDYKRQLIQRGDLSPSQITEFGSDTHRTRSEIDSLYQKLSAESAEQRAKERAYWESEVRRGLETEPVEP